MSSINSVLVMLPLMKDGEWAACQQRSTDMKAGGANTLQHVLKKPVCDGEEPSGPWGAAGHGPTVIWLTELENGPEGLSVKGKRWRISGEKFKTSISEHSASLVTTLNGCRDCTDTWVLLRSRSTPQLCEFPLSWTGPGWKSISTLLLLQPWKEGRK